MRKNQNGSIETVLLIIFVSLWLVVGIIYTVHRISQKPQPAQYQTNQSSTPKSQVKIDDSIEN